MKKGVVIGIGLSIIVVAIIVGIASLPDEILIENPSLETSENLPQTEEPVEETVVEEPVEEPLVEEPVEEESEEESSDDDVIKVEIRDGIGSGDQ